MTSQFEIYIQITFPINKPEEFKIRTNAKKEAVGDLLGEYVRAIQGAGEDNSPANDHEVYTINLVIDLADDTWRSSSDCGNKGLRDGIVMDVWQRIEGKQAVVDWLLEDVT